jgi:phosphoribosylformylglycinamidine synthase
MIHVVRVALIDENEDFKGLDILNNLREDKISKVRTVRVYRLEGIDRKEAKYLAEKLLSESINQKYTIDEQVFNARSSIEIAYKPGVMNPEVASIVKASKDLKIKLLAADSSWEYHFFGTVSLENIKKLRLYNPLIEYIVESEPETLLIEGRVGPTNKILIRNASDEDLMELSRDKLFLNLEEMKVIQNYFKKIKRDPTDIELETLAQTWSEHCAHKTFKANLIIDGKKKEPLIERIKKEALKHNKNIVSAFGDNSGVMKFYDGYSICGKVETHNSPSAIEQPISNTAIRRRLRQITSSARGLSRPLR